MEFGRELESDIRICDPEGSVLWGHAEGDFKEQAFFQVEGTVHGTVCVNRGVGLLASFLSLLTKQAMERHALAQETLDKYKEINLLYRVAEKITQTLEIPKVAKLFVDEARRLVKSSSASLMLLDEETGKLAIICAAGEEHHPKTVLEPGRGIAGAVILSGKTEVVNKVEKDERFVDKSSPIRSLISSPLKSLDQVVGVLNISSETPMQYSAADAKLITALAMLAASAVVNLRAQQKLVREQLHARMMEQDLEIGRQIQKSFLPEELPSIANWEIAYRFRAALQVSGDFYDIFPLARGKLLGIAVADVCTKGVGAALFMGLFRSLIRAYCSLCFPENFLEPTGEKEPTLSQQDQTSRVASKLQRVISLTNDYTAVNHGQTNMFATIFLGIIDVQSGLLHYINGGHEMPYLIEPLTKGIRHLRPTGPAVGLMPKMPFETNTIPIQRGETLIVYTDGVTEAMNPDGVLFGEDRLHRLLFEPTKSVEQLLGNIEQAIDQHTTTAPQSDDITLLAVKRLPIP